MAHKELTKEEKVKVTDYFIEYLKHHGGYNAPQDVEALKKIVAAYKGEPEGTGTGPGTGTGGTGGSEGGAGSTTIEKAKKHLLDSYNTWEKEYHDKACQDTNLKWHFRDDAAKILRVKEAVEAVIEAKFGKTLPAGDAGLIIQSTTLLVHTMNEGYGKLDYVALRDLMKLGHNELKARIDALILLVDAPVTPPPTAAPAATTGAAGGPAVTTRVVPPARAAPIAATTRIAPGLRMEGEDRSTTTRTPPEHEMKRGRTIRLP